MRTLHAIVMLLGALSVLTLGAIPVMAAPDAPPPACHETGRAPDAGSPDQVPAMAMKAMACCVVCVTAPDLQPPVRARVLVTARPAVQAKQRLPNGRSPAPDPFPPR